jgi:hypothetical protein
MFLRYDCGCIGFPNPEGGDPICVQACDRDGDDPQYSGYPRKDLATKGATPLSGGYTIEIVMDLLKSYPDAEKYRQIRSLLGVPS